MEFPDPAGPGPGAGAGGWGSNGSALRVSLLWDEDNCHEVLL